MSNFVIFLVAISLSMDAFSLSLLYGTLDLEPKKELLVSIIVGMFHFFMPIIGLIFGKITVNLIDTKIDRITGIIFIGLAVEMLLSINNKDDIKELVGIISLFFFALAVSVDSFFMGINLGINNTNIILSSTIFMITSMVFTLIGLKIGNKIKIKMGNLSTIVGSIILLILGVIYLK